MPPKISEAAPASPSSASQIYRYRNSRPWSVLGLSIMASVVAVAVIAGAWSGLTSATDQERIAPPPDLRKVVSKAEQTGEKIVNGAKTALSEQRQDEATVPANAPDQVG